MNSIRTPLLLALLLLLGGCLEIDGQDVHLRFDAERDRIDAMFVYRGVFAEGSAGGGGTPPIDKAIGDLELAKQTGEFVFWNNWPLSCDPCRDYDAPRNALIRHLEVENGGLFTDPQGVLCAWQFVRINKARAFVRKLNLMLEVAVQAGLSGGIKQLDGHKLDDDTKELVREFLRSGEKMLTIADGRIELRLPLSAKDHAWLKQVIEGHVLDNLPREITRREVVAERRKGGGSVTDTSHAEEVVTIEGPDLRKEIARAPSFRFLWDNDISIQRTAELTTLGIGVEGTGELRVHKARDGIYHDALLKKLRDKGEQIEDGLPDQELLRRFDAFRARDARLPPKLAAKRG
ncbi:MAG: hypothetical protein KAI24_07000 [Planctomycetes bacterium]|nr:hypothetical protein [Planctomycetota bacterium]